ncbi:hypothetical protein, partial [Burkholderia cepacia]|uniref:hypothetical protein n=1 Tax=Burkholderia cepacia TaxID=292 RepID=UPI001C6130A2
DNHDRITTDNHPGRPAKMIVGKPAMLLDAIYDLRYQGKHDSPVTLPHGLTYQSPPIGFRSELEHG